MIKYTQGKDYKLKWNFYTKSEGLNAWKNCINQQRMWQYAQERLKRVDGAAKVGFNINRSKAPVRANAYAHEIGQNGE